MLRVTSAAMPSSDNKEVGTRLAMQAAALEADNSDPLGLGRIDPRQLTLVSVFCWANGPTLLLVKPCLFAQTRCCHRQHVESVELGALQVRADEAKKVWRTGRILVSYQPVCLFLAAQSRHSLSMNQCMP